MGWGSAGRGLKKKGKREEKEKIRFVVTYFGKVLESQHSLISGFRLVL